MNTVLRPDSSDRGQAWVEARCDAATPMLNRGSSRVVIVEPSLDVAHSSREIDDSVALRDRALPIARVPSRSTAIVDGDNPLANDRAIRERDEPRIGLQAGIDDELLREARMHSADVTDRAHTWSEGAWTVISL